MNNFDLTDHQIQQLSAFCEEITEINKSINLISRKDIEQIQSRHMLPSLAIGKICPFAKNSKILDVGTGGGFPGLPLAIMFPDSHFTLVDSIGKKIRTVESIAKKLNLTNVTCKQLRIEDFNEKFDFVIGRAVTALPRFIQWTAKNVRGGHHSKLENGILYLKGGDFSEELKDTSLNPTEVFNIHHIVEDKCIVYFSHPIALLQ